MPLDRRAERLLAMLAATQSDPGATETPAGRRAALGALAQMADDASAPAETRDLDCPGPDGPIPLRLYSPPETTHDPLPGLVFFHGGGWVAGDLDTHDGLCRRLALAAGCHLVAVHYRRAPEHPFPAALDDGLAAAVAIAARDAGGPHLVAQLLICPILDVGRTSGSRAALADGYFISQAAFAGDLAAYLPPDAVAADPRLSPLRAIDLTGLPPTILHTAEFDPFQDEGDAYAERLRAAGVAIQTTRHAGQIHYFYAMARAIPAAHAAATLIGTQLRAVFAAG